MPADKISLEAAAKEKLFYFVANVVVYRGRDKKCLILKRHEREKVHPGKYAVIGGKLEWKDLDIAHPTRVNGEVLDYEHAVEALLVREVKEEADITIRSQLQYLNSVAYIRPDGIPVMLVKFAAKYKNGKVVPERGSFTAYAWVNEKEVKAYNCVDGIKEEVAQTIALFASRSSVNKY